MKDYIKIWNFQFVSLCSTVLRYEYYSFALPTELLRNIDMNKEKEELSLWTYGISRQLPIFPARHQASIFGVDELNFCVRNGNRWDLIAIITDLRSKGPLDPSKLNKQTFLSNEFIQDITNRSSPRPISTRKLHTLPYLHFEPINLIVFQGSYSI